MRVVLTFEELGVPDNFQTPDIINRACDMVMTLMFPEFEEHDVIDHDEIVVSYPQFPHRTGAYVTVPITVEWANPF